jgi:hypothetical protein
VRHAGDQEETGHDASLGSMLAAPVGILIGTMAIVVA